MAVDGTLDETMPSLREQFGQRLKSIRLQRKLTQEAFSELIGISLDMLSVIERGRHSPSFDKLEQMAERLEVSVAYLFTFPPEKTKKVIGK